jgi:hypothetical protein
MAKFLHLLLKRQSAATQTPNLPTLMPMSFNSHANWRELALPIFSKHKPLSCNSGCQSDATPTPMSGRSSGHRGTPGCTPPTGMSSSSSCGSGKYMAKPSQVGGKFRSRRGTLGCTPSLDQLLEVVRTGQIHGESP